MLITNEIFDDFLNCETKSYFKFLEDTELKSERLFLKRTVPENYERQCHIRLRSDLSEAKCLTNPAFEQLSQNNDFQIAFNCFVHSGELQTRIHALECLNHSGENKGNYFIPIRFVLNEKITKRDKLRLAFDALVLAVASGTMPPFGKIIHSHKIRIVKVQLAGLMDVVRGIIDNIAAQQISLMQPETILKSHCAGCEFQSRCRREALEKDSLSLLSGISEKERRRLQNRGILTVTQLSYTFRPRRRSSRSESKPIKSSFALKALAIRENKIHIAGKPALNLTGTPVFLDVEGIPDQDFYYLIGLRCGSGDTPVQYSFWADEKNQEKEIWKHFLQILRAVDNPQLIYYGSYETTFLKRMKERYGQTIKDKGFIDDLIARSINMLSTIYAQIYFPTYSNGLKDIARYLGFCWSEETASGFQSIIWRKQWELVRDYAIKELLITYNREDCQALEKVFKVVTLLCRKNNEATTAIGDDIIHADLLKREYPQRFGKIVLALPELESINKAAYWDYQRDKIYVRSNPRLKSPAPKKDRIRSKALPVNKIIECPAPPGCLKCQSERIFKYGKMSRLVYDLKFGTSAIKRCIVKYLCNRYLCWDCRATFVSYENSVITNKYGTELTAFVIYQMIGLKIPQLSVAEIINRLFKLPVTGGTISHQKALAADFYQETYQIILSRILNGNLIHADETRANVKGKTAYVWILTNLEEVAYIYTETRGGDFLAELLQGFKGVLVSDFYAAYDSINCPQQKCLIHLMRDLNDDLLKQPFNGELKELLKEFAGLLKPIVETIDRFGLKTRHLRKHRTFVEGFYKRLVKRNYQNEIVIKYRKRFEKNRDKLFTFLDYDGIPWNNNNAEHTIKAFAKLRNVMGGSTTEKGLRDYLTLLSVSETCQYKSINFLDFLRSRKKNIDVFNR